MLASHGRGGAGNMADSTLTQKPTAQDLQTPTLKNPVVTTGRGGTGNMANAKDPQSARKLQDVEASGAQYAGRGGAGNVFKNDEGAELARKATNNDDVIEEEPEFVKETQPQTQKKGKTWLFGKKA